MKLIDLPSPGQYSNSQRLRIETVKAISAVEVTHTGSGNAVLTIAVNAAGTGYTPGTYTLTVTGGGGSGAAATAVVEAGGTVQSVTLVSGGSGYTTNPTFALPAEAGAGTGSTFTITRGTAIRTSAEAEALADFFTAAAAALADFIPA